MVRRQLARFIAAMMLVIQTSVAMTPIALLAHSHDDHGWHVHSADSADQRPQCETPRHHDDHRHGTDGRTIAEVATSAGAEAPASVMIVAPATESTSILMDLADDPFILTKFRPSLPPPAEPPPVSESLIVVAPSIADALRRSSRSVHFGNDDDLLVLTRALLI